MQRVRIGIIGTGASVEWAILPTLSGSDALAPPDTGAWWSRRPTASSDITYQAPATPEVVALCAGAPRDARSDKIAPKTSPRLETLGRAARGAALYGEPRALLREMPLDALLIAAGDEGEIEALPLIELVASAPGMREGIAPPRWVWIDGPPARSLAELGAFARFAAGNGPCLWIAAPLRRAAAHRAARRLLERDGIGEVTAVQARFSFPLDTARFGAAYAAFDLLLSFLPEGAGMPREVTAARHNDGAASVLLKLAGGATLTALFGAADAWNCPLPRIEICGTQGRTIVCEAGRRMWHYVPREGARLWEPPGLAPHVSAANIAGYAEDLKAFLAVCVNNPAPFNAERALSQAARALGALDATFLSMQLGCARSIEARGPQMPEVPTGESAAVVSHAVAGAAEWAAPPRNLTLDLG